MTFLLKDRARWAINYISEKNSLSNTKIGKMLGISGDTVNSYRSKTTDPKVNFIVNFCDAFGFDLKWFVKGDGEPFPGAREQFPEICGEPVDISVCPAEENSSFPNNYTDLDTGNILIQGRPARRVIIDKPKEIPVNDQKMGLGMAVDMLATIFNSGNHTIIRAIMDNLEAFSDAVTRRQEDSDRIRKLEDKCEELMKRIETLEEKAKSESVKKSAA